MINLKRKLVVLITFRPESRLKCLLVTALAMHSVFISSVRNFFSLSHVVLGMLAHQRDSLTHFQSRIHFRKVILNRNGNTANHIIHDRNSSHIDHRISIDRGIAQQM